MFTSPYSPSAELPVFQPLSESRSLIIVSDVDGVLRDAETRSLDQTRGALEFLANRGIPIVLCSHHSAPELMWLQRELGFREPFICESGAALFVPGGYFQNPPDLGTSEDEWDVTEFAPPRIQVVGVLRRVAERLRATFVGYSDLSVEQLARENNMTMDEAQLATARSYDEPFRLAGSARDREQLFTAMRDAGYRCFRGVRFDHATGLLDQGHAIRLLISLYRTCAESPVVIGVGDNWTDRVLLQEVDVPIIVRNHTVDQSGLLRKVPTAYLTDRDGPAGWVEAILGSAGV